MKTKYIFFIGVLILFLMTFFFKTIPIPVENIEGINNPDKFIYGGSYWTSGLFQLSVANYLGFFSYFGIFILLIGGIYLLE